MEALNKFELGVAKLYWYTFLPQQHTLLSIFLRSHESKQENYFRHNSRSELATSHNTTCITPEHYMPLFGANYLQKRGPMEATKWNRTHDHFSCFLWNLRFIFSDSHKKLSLVLLQIALPNYFRELVESVQGRTIKDFFSREKSSKHLNLRLRLVWLQH